MGDLGDGGDGGLPGTARDSLFDGHGGRNAGQPVDVRPGQLLDELARIRRHRLHEASLAFGKDDVEGEGGFARAGNARDDRELPVRNGEGDIFQVVLPGTDQTHLAGHERQTGLIRCRILRGGELQAGVTY